MTTKKNYQIRLPRYENQLFNKKLVFKTSIKQTECKGDILNISHLGFKIKFKHESNFFTPGQVIPNLKAFANNQQIYDGKVTILDVEKMEDSKNTFVLRLGCLSNIVDIPKLINVPQRMNIQTEYKQILTSIFSKNIEPEFLSIINQLKNFLIKSKEYFESVEKKIEKYPYKNVDTIRKEIINEVRRDFKNIQHENFTLLNKMYLSMSQKEQNIHKNFCREQLQKYYLVSQFIHRSIQKPLNYSGDYIQILFLLNLKENDFSSLPIYEQLINEYALEIDPAIAHRNRIDYLLSTLIQEHQRNVGSLQSDFQFTSIGCGPAEEVMRFVKNGNCQNTIATLIDLETRTLEYCNEYLTQLVGELGNDFQFQTIQRNAKDFKYSEFCPKNQNLIYCAGLFDYLKDGMCKKIIKSLYEQLRPGGLLIFTNVSKKNRFLFFMESIMEWNLILRSEKEMKNLCDFLKPDQIQVALDKTQTNIFIEIRK